MKLFLDANVIISVLNKEYPLFTYSARILSLGAKKGYKLFTSPLCLAIAFYFSSKKSGDKIAKQKITTLVNHISITSINENMTKKAIKNPVISDFEDGMQYYSAVNSSCDIIITENSKDFYFGEIPALDCETFIVNCL